MKFIRFLVFSLFLMPVASFAAGNDFMVAAQLLAAAKSADIQQVQALVNNGADVNYVDATGVSIVCTALMNNDVRAAQILQMYGADASQCDRQIKQYNNRNKPKGSGGLFSGLSSAQSISLAAAGAAVVVGGLFLLTDVFDPGNDNDSSSGGGDRPNNNPDGGNNGGTAVAGISVPYSPAYLGADGKITSSDAVYRDNLATWNPTTDGVKKWDYDYFRPLVQTENNFLRDGIDVPLQNYLLVMHGYSAFANDYMGQEIFRDVATRNPVRVGNSAGGGRPVIAGLVTANGVSATGSLVRTGGISYSDSAAADSPAYLVDKFANFDNPANGVLGAEIAGFDLSGSGTALNPFASSMDSALGKIVAGWNAGGRSYGDLFGFVPNGRLGIFRTGGGQAWVNLENPTGGTVAGTVTGDANNIAVGDSLTIGGVTYEISNATDGSTIMNSTIVVDGTSYRVPDGATLFKGVCSGADCDDVSDIAIYVGTDGYYYVNTTGGDSVDAVYVVQDNNLYAQKELVDADYKNFQALGTARGVSDVLANVSITDASRGADYLTITDMPAALALNKTFIELIDSVYDRDATDPTSQGAYAHTLFNSYAAGHPIMVMPAGEFALGIGAGKSPSVLDATFENYAPLLYGNNLNHLFMTVVAVQHTTGTTGADTIEGYGNGVGTKYGPLYLASWVDDNGTPDDDSDDTQYMSRKCGVAGLGLNGIDPWCFSAAGPTAEMATASAAGAVAALKGAFGYMSNPQIFMLMALTADGYLLGTDASGNAFTSDTLANYLRSLYRLPPEKYEDTLSADEYLKAFADVYGYGMINLERAMTPNKKIYFFDGNANKIVSGDGNAYWRAAANTVFRPSAVLNIRGASVGTSFYDVLESADGKISLPRVWNTEFAMGATDKRGLYMGDVLGELNTRRDASKKTQIGNIGFSLAVSDSLYADNLGGLDNMTLDYANGNWNFAASYQRYQTDGASRFDGLANPVLGLVSGAMGAGAEYNSGKWTFGTRVFSGAITEEGLLENDPTIAAQYLPAKLGLAMGAQSSVGWKNDSFALTTSVGMMHETDTVLGAQASGLLDMGAGRTTYVDALAKYALADDVNLTARATFARTSTDASGNFILGLSDIQSNAFAFGANIGNWEFSVAQPLAITDASMQYAYAKYDVNQVDNNNYQLNVVETKIADLDLSARQREVRFTGTYRHRFGEFTDGAVGFIYRVNPNHTDEFGNESIFMMKMSHRVGI